VAREEFYKSELLGCKNVVLDFAEVGINRCKPTVVNLDYAFVVDASARSNSYQSWV